jgi:FMN phosphatase YigB (HAD superfamily)
MNKIILTDADGVLLSWEDHFHEWMEARGYNKVKNDIYHINEQYDMSRQKSKQLVEEFNNSAWIGWCPALRDARSGVATLAENGYKFICITSLSLDPYAKELRWQNLRTLFGVDPFVDLVCLDTGADKDAALEPYRNSGLWWIEDKPENAVLGADFGLNTLLVDHTYNRELNDSRIRRVYNWKDITGIILNERSARAA